MADFSVLMSVYKGEKSEYLEMSLNSVFSQTLRSSEVILIKDGPLTSELESVINSFETKYSEMKVLSFQKNRGLGRCLNDGLKVCSFDIIARMDTDDIARPERFEVEYNFLNEHPEYDLVGSWIEEFVSSPNEVISLRKVPQKPDDIYNYAKRRCPVNHPTVMYRKNAVLKAGGYLEKYFPEDYFLWIRMLMKGSKFYNINRPLLWFRYSPETVRKRGGWSYAKDELRIQLAVYRIGFISFPIMLENMIIRFITRITPYGIRKSIYRLIRKV